MEKLIEKPYFSVLVFVFLVFIDQFSKYLIRFKGGFYICNPDIAWGISIQPIVFWVVWVIIILFMLFMLIFCLKISNFQFLISPPAFGKFLKLLKIKISKIFKENKSIQTNRHWRASNKIPNSKFQILNSSVSAFGILFIFSGALSNIFDRIRIGCVVDFIQVPWWPMFNFADCFIAIGAIILLVKWLKL